MEKLNKKFHESNGVLTQGTIHVHHKGFAFVSPDDSEEFPEDIFIPKHLKGNAVDGDRVEIVISPDRKPDKGPEGLVSSIIERSKEELVGVVWIIKSKGEYIVTLIQTPLLCDNLFFDLLQLLGERWKIAAFDPLKPQDRLD